MAKKLTFEDKLEKLDGILKEMESDELPLQTSLKLFEEGIRLSKECQKELDEAKFKVSVLMENEQGEMEPAPMEGVEEA